MRRGGIAAAICAAPIALEAAGLLRGRRATAYPGFREELDSVSESVADRVVNKLGRMLGARGLALRRARVLCLGVTYKPDVADLRESAALKVLAELRWQGAEARYWDPHFPEVQLGSETFRSVDLDDESLDWADAVVLLVPHTGPDYRRIARKTRLLLDTVNHLAGLASPNVVSL